MATRIGANVKLDRKEHTTAVSIETIGNSFASVQSSSGIHGTS